MSDLSVPTSPISSLHDLPSTAKPYRFTWDSSRKGPQSISATTEGRGDYFSHHPPLGFLNTSLTNLPLTALPTEWSSSKHGFHAISTVLNNPHKNQAPPKAHSSLPAVQPADLPRVRRKDFDSYLRAIAPEWENYERNLALGREGQAQLDSITNQWLLSTTEEDGPPQPQKHFSPIQTKSIPPLSTVPSVFFDSNFNLADTHTFNVVAEHDLHTETTEPFSQSLLDRFSHYADTVEQHLIREISIRSTPFFAALTNLQDLQSESELCLDRVSRLRKLLKDVDDNTAKKGLEMVRRECRMANLGTVKEGVRMVGGVVEMTGVARGLVNAGQWGEALAVIEEIKKLWDNVIQDRPAPQKLNGNGRLPSMPEEGQRPSKQSPKIPLAALHAFAALPTHLHTLTLEIASSLSSELVAVLRGDFEARINREDDTVVDEGLKDRLTPPMQGLVRTNGLKEGVLSWREVVLNELRGIIDKALDVNENGRSTMATQLQKMPHSEFVGLMRIIYRQFLNGIEGLKSQQRVVNEILESLKSQTYKISLDIPVLEEELDDIISSAAELSNTQAAKIVSYREEQHAALDLPDFLVFFNESWSFVLKCEVICRRMIVGLRGTVVGHAKLFLQQFHQARLTRSAKLVEDELWNSIEIPPQLQHVVDVLMDSAVRDSPELVIKSDDSESTSSPIDGTNSVPGSGVAGIAADATKQRLTTLLSSESVAAQMLKSKTNGASAQGWAKHVRVEERTFYLVSATADVLILLLDYIKVIVNLSMLTTDTMSRVIEFLKAFNSRTCQVVLGAGAMRSAGLKNITAKHLALASQSLSIVSELIPYVRETFRRHLSQTQAVMLVEFDKLKRDYQEHQNEIHAKLIAIMGDRLGVHIRTLQGVDWTVPKADGGINTYIEVLVKETVTLHKVLSRYLAGPIVEYVMTQVFAAINHRLSEEYTKIELPHQDAKIRLLADAKYLHQHLSALRNVSAPTGMLETVIAEKSFPRPATPQAAASPKRNSTLISSVSTSANQRLKGLLSGRNSSFDKALPTPVSSPTPPIPEKSSSPAPSIASTRNGIVALGTEASMSSTSLIASTSPPVQEPDVKAGFRQVEEEPVLNSEPEPMTEASQADGESKLDNDNGVKESLVLPPPTTDREPEA